MKVGKVSLVGAGPGDPGLITQKGLECLARADVIIYDHLLDERLLDSAVACMLPLTGTGKKGMNPLTSR